MVVEDLEAISTELTRISNDVQNYASGDNATIITLLIVICRLLIVQVQRMEP